MENIRCGCGALLFRMTAGALAGRVEIKCRRCGAINSIRAAEPITRAPCRASAGDLACHASNAAPSGRRPSITATPLK
ncbi:MAG: hypothetical protein DI527_16505 [Chelatococcus sp.]|nr:MAG: hypothetical protein DI527_16505 [Chelatococcus sp.]